MIKQKIYTFLILLFSIFIINKTNASNLELMGKIIYLDPGHGGLDNGAVYKNVKEAPINLEICKKLDKILTSKGAIVYMTRYDNNDLSIPFASNHKKSDLNQRIKLINESNADIYISIHLNAEEKESWHGAQVFYNNINPKNKDLALIFQKEFEKLNSKRKIKEINDLYLYKNVKVPGVLLEVGFISNPEERNLLQTDEYQEKLANTIVKGIVKYFSIT